MPERGMMGEMKPTSRLRKNFVGRRSKSIRCS